MTTILDTILLLALPASGKSEVRKYLDGLSPRECQEEFHIGPTVQLDDFPYVHLMRRIDDELAAAESPRIFFRSPEQPFQNPLDWRTLIELVNEDHADLVTRRKLPDTSFAEVIFDRFDVARCRVGASPALGRLPPRVRSRVAERLEKEAAELYRAKASNVPESLNGKTLVVEFARGGPDGASMPLALPLGYLGSIPFLSPAILERAAILYIWVTPEESRRKNQARANPDDPGSILHHGVPMEVMLGEYGCDDMEYLLSRSGRANAVSLPAYGREFVLPVARFDNRVDKTSFVRNPKQTWRPEDVRALHEGLKEALGRLCEARGFETKRG